MQVWNTKWAVYLQRVLGVNFKGPRLLSARHHQQRQHNQAWRDSSKRWRFPGDGGCLSADGCQHWAFLLINFIRLNQDSNWSRWAFSVTLAAMSLSSGIYEETFPCPLISDHAADTTSSCLFQFLIVRSIFTFGCCFLSLNVDWFPSCNQLNLSVTLLPEFCVPSNVCCGCPWCHCLHFRWSCAVAPPPTSCLWLV